MMMPSATAGAVSDDVAAVKIKIRIEQILMVFSPLGERSTLHLQGAVRYPAIEAYDAKYVALILKYCGD